MVLGRVFDKLQLIFARFVMALICQHVEVVGDNAPSPFCYSACLCCPFNHFLFRLNSTSLPSQTAHHLKGQYFFLPLFVHVPSRCAWLGLTF